MDEEGAELRPAHHPPTHHLQFDLDAEALLLHGGHAGGEGLPHAGGAAQGQLGAALQAGDGARQDGGAAGPAQEQAADVLPAGAAEDGGLLAPGSTAAAFRPGFLLLGVLQQRGGVLGGGVVAGVAQPALGVVLDPVGPVAVAQQEEVGLLPPQEQVAS